MKYLMLSGDRANGMVLHSRELGDIVCPEHNPTAGIPARDEVVTNNMMKGTFHVWRT